MYLLSFIFGALGADRNESRVKGLLKKLWLITRTGGVKGDEGLRVPVSSSSTSGRWIEIFCSVFFFSAIFFFIHQYTADVAGFADTYGYVSEAVRLSQGRFYEPEQVYSFFGLPEEANKSHPLGFVEKGSQGTVPIYPFGYPLIMAAFIKTFGLQGAYWVTPLLAAGTILLTYWLGKAFLGVLGGIMAAGLVLFLPNFLHSSFLPMSDVPATFFFSPRSRMLTGPAPLSPRRPATGGFPWFRDMGPSEYDSVGVTGSGLVCCSPGMAEADPFWFNGFSFYPVQRLTEWILIWRCLDNRLWESSARGHFTEYPGSRYPSLDATA